MADERKCNECGGKLPADAPQGLCPQCLMKLGLPSEAGSDESVPLNDQAAIPTSATPPGGFVPPEPEELAKKFPQLEILELLGQGGMGAVYKARQKQLDRLVALKILPPEVGRDPAFAERFSREARSLAKLNHPRIVSVFDFGHTEDGVYYFIMEFVDGTDLRRVIEGGQLDPAEALAIVPQICEALQYAHEEGLVHRDIKPENILLDKKGRVKIADFGLAKLLGKPATAYTLTQAGQRMGTPHYMAPEQIEGAHEVDHRADIYSLGVVFYEMLTGQLPIGRFAPPSQKVQVDVRLDNVVLKSLEHEPERRYQHASEVKTDVETISASHRSASPVAGRRPAAAYNPMEKHVTIIAALKIAFGAMGLVGGLIAFVAVTAGGVISRDPMALRITAVVGPGIFALIAVGSIPGIVGGVGLLKRRPWARILMIIIGILDLLWVPFGTILGIYILWAMLKEQTLQLLEPAPVAAASPAVSHLPSGIAPTGRPGPAVNHQAIRRRLRVPAIGLIITGIISCSPIIFAAGMLLLKSHAGGSFVFLPGAMAIIALVSAPAILIIIAGSKMLRLRSYGLAVAGSIIALAPCHPAFPVGLIFGIWSLVILSGIDVQAAFGRSG